MLNNTKKDAGLKEPNTAAEAWAEMLARIGEKHARLSSIAATAGNEKNDRSSVVGEIEKERGRIARELHAGAGQPLAGIKISLEPLDELFRSLPSVHEEARKSVATIHLLVDAALSQVRAVSHRLHPPRWQELSTVESLRLLVNESGVTRKFTTSLKLGPLNAEPSHAVKVVLYRCAQECISNALRHSGAKRFGLSLVAAADEIAMIVVDDGCGIPEDALRRSGIGLASIREHVSSVQGVTRMSSDVRGTTIQISLPLVED